MRKMATSIISVSVPYELAQFLEENADISPSKIIQNKLFEMKNDENRLNVRIKAYEIRNSRLSEKLERILRWAEDNNITIPENVLD